MIGAFSINSYIGLKDTSLSTLQPLHGTFNFLMAAVDLLAAYLLINYSEKRFWVLLSGVVWPAVFLISIIADVESRLCLFTNQNCFASVSNAYQYLILGQSSQGWKLWTYTFPTLIGLLLTVIILALAYSLMIGKLSPAIATMDNEPRSNRN